MGVAYMENCIMSQGVQGKKNFDFPTYGSRVMGQNVKRPVIAPPWGRSIWLCFNGYFNYFSSSLCTSPPIVGIFALTVSEGKILEFELWPFCLEIALKWMGAEKFTNKSISIKVYIRSLSKIQAHDSRWSRSVWHMAHNFPTKAAGGIIGQTKSLRGLYTRN